MNERVKGTICTIWVITVFLLAILSAFGLEKIADNGVVVATALAAVCILSAFVLDRKL